jgi:hypothetical protein
MSNFRRLKPARGLTISIRSSLNYFLEFTSLQIMGSYSFCRRRCPLAAIRKMSEEIKPILLNKQAIALNQDAGCLQAHLIYKKDSLQVWAKNLNGDQGWVFALALSG